MMRRQWEQLHIDLQYVAGAVTGAMTQWRMSAPSIRRFILMRMAPINFNQISMDLLPI